jgi:hypothetical protein
MDELLKIIGVSSPFLALIVIVGYFIKRIIEKRIDFLSNRVEEIGKTSLLIKKDLRTEERKELIDFRMALEEWQYFLQTSLFDYSIISSSNISVEKLYRSDKKYFLNVKISSVKVSSYLRNEKLETDLNDLILKIRKLYYPIINESMPSLIDIKTRLAFFENKLTKFQESGMQDMNYAPTEMDRKENNELQEMLTKEVENFSHIIIENYRQIAVLLDEIRAEVNNYLYRPIKRTEIDQD